MPHQTKNNHQCQSLKNDPVTHDAIGIFYVVGPTACHCKNAPEENTGKCAQCHNKHNLVKLHERLHPLFSLLVGATSGRRSETWPLRLTLQAQISYWIRLISVFYQIFPILTPWRRDAAIMNSSGVFPIITNRLLLTVLLCVAFVSFAVGCLLVLAMGLLTLAQ